MADTSNVPGSIPTAWEWVKTRGGIPLQRRRMSARNAWNFASFDEDEQVTWGRPGESTNTVGPRCDGGERRTVLGARNGDELAAASEAAQRKVARFASRMSRQHDTDVLAVCRWIGLVH